MDLCALLNWLFGSFGQTTLSVVFGGLITIVITIIVESVRRPKLTLKAAPSTNAAYPNNAPARKGRYVGVTLRNEPIHWGFQWMSRSPALQCRGEIRFYHSNGKEVFDKPMPIRFASSREPILPRIILGNDEGVLYDLEKLSLDSRIDLYPGEATFLDVAVRFDEDEAAYGWTNANYHSQPRWRNPEWILPKGKYQVQVAVVSSGQKYTANFRLVNNEGLAQFRLETLP